MRNTSKRLVPEMIKRGILPLTLIIIISILYVLCSVKYNALLGEGRNTHIGKDLELSKGKIINFTYGEERKA